MDQSYPYTREFAYQYTFVSRGKERIEKAVIFSLMPIANVYNIGFGDVKVNGSIDDRIRTNNGDLIRVLGTVIQIVKTFLKEHPSATVFFVGSSPSRTALYRRILKTYYQAFSNDFIISAFIGNENNPQETLFEPNSNQEYLGFLVKKIV